MIPKPPPLQVADELAEMLELYTARRPRRVLEIGVWQGGTLRHWLAGNPELVVAVDTLHSNAGAYFAWCRDTTLVPLKGRSQDPEIVEQIKTYARRFDWIFVDGDHALEAVRTDVTNALELLAPGGLILMHDIVGPSSGPLDGHNYPPGIVFDSIAETGAHATDTILSRAPSYDPHGIGLIYAQ